VPRHGLDRAAVVAAAAAVADEAGLEQVTLARVAERLGVRSPSLYHHVAGLPGLRRELALGGLRALEAQLARAAVGKSRDDAVLALADAFRAFAHAHPGLYAATLRSPDSADDELTRAGQDVVDVVLAALAAYGLSGDDALHATRALRAIVHGFVSLEATGGFGLPLDLDESFHRLVRAYSLGLTQRR
jgi:AcrR family transcriptional regulator